jgi:hypothetical protein
MKDKLGVIKTGVMSVPAVPDEWLTCERVGSGHGARTGWVAGAPPNRGHRLKENES